MKPFFSLGIAGLIFLVSSGLHAQSESKVTGCRLQALSREQGTGDRGQVADNRKTESSSENQIGQQAEITANYELPTANCDNSGKDLSYHLMMNPAMVEESEEAIEQFILGKTRSALPVKRQNYSENTAREQVAENQEFTTPPPRRNSV